MTGAHTGPRAGSKRIAVFAALGLVSLALCALVARPAAADPLQVRGLVDAVQAAPAGEGAEAAALADAAALAIGLPAKAVRTANEAIIEQLVALGPGAAIDITPHLLDGRPEVRLVVIEALARLKADSAVDPLVELLDHTDLATAVAAADALGRLSGPRAGSTLRTLIRRRLPAPAPDPVRRAAIRALPGTTDATTLLPFVLPLLDLYTTPEDTAATVACLAGIGDPSSIDAVAPLLRDPARRLPALLGLAGYGVYAVPLLEQDLVERGSSTEAKQQVADAALLLGEPGIPVLERILRTSSSPELDLHILDGLVIVPDRAAVDRLLRRYLTHRSPAYVVAAVKQLGDDKDTEALSGLHRLLEHDDLAVRTATAHAIGQLATPASVNPLTFALTREVARRDREENTTLRREVIWALGQIRSEGAVPVLIGGLDVPDQREAAMDALVLAGREAIRTLVLIIKSGDQSREAAAIETILRIGDAAGRDVVGLLEHPEKRARTIGFELTAAVGDESAIPVLTKMALDPLNPNRLDALRVLGVFYTPELRPVFQRVIQKGDIKLQKTALQALWRHGDSDATTYVLELAEESKDPELRSAAIFGAFFMGAPGALGLFQRVVQYDKPLVRSAATEALSLMGEPRVIPQLAKAIPDAPPEYQAELRAALMRIMRYQGDAAKPPDFLDWYDDYEDDFPAAGKPDEGDEDEFGTVDLGGGARLVYRITGDEDDPLVVALHDGPDGDSSLLRRGLGDLDDDFRLVTYDRRGRGRSRAAAGADDADAAWDGYSLEREAGDLEALRRHLGRKRLSLVAHGFGANVAIRYAASFPQYVDRIVLLNAPYPIAETVRGRSARVQARLSGPALNTVRWIEGRRGYFPRQVYNERWGYYALPAFFHDPAKANRYRAPGFDEVLRESALARVPSFNLEDAIVTIRRPILVLLADDDLYPEALQKRWKRLVSLVPGGAKLRTLEEAGHFLFLERDDDTLDQTRDFLEGD